MRRMMSAASAVAATAAALVGGATSASAAAAAGPTTNCPRGYVCIFELDGEHPIDKFYTYGAHNLSNKIGVYWVTNNQTDGATVSLCYEYNGTHCYAEPPLKPGYAYARDLTPINSLRLNQP